MIKNVDFEKLHGLGNDYVLINDLKWKIPEESMGNLANILCQPHFSIGADGLIFICNPEEKDLRMRIFNPDGSEAEMCGNGIRCFAKYVYENDICRKLKIEVETLKRIVKAELNVNNGIVESVKIDMGEPILNCDEIPVITESLNDKCINESILAIDKVFKFTAVSMGNPHAIIFTEKLPNDEELNRYGANISSNSVFPKKINVEFVKPLSQEEATLRVFERGVGITNSCGTGTCAAVVAGSIIGVFKNNHPITVHNDGGDLIITYNGKTVFMEGPATRVFKGLIDQIEL
ncbi:MAG: diaminopimelate epimerase [Candidatus Hermodarchaeota archaeon]